MAFEVEWTNPIFYLNFGALVLAMRLYWRARRSKSRIQWTWLIFAVGTGLHFIGDLFQFPEEKDHFLIHTVVLIALFFALLMAAEG